MLKKMNLPNKLTMLRIILVPILILILTVTAENFENIEESLLDKYNEKTKSVSTEEVANVKVWGMTKSKIEGISDLYYPVVGTAALVVFLVAAITDFLDGRISRKANIVTKFGKIMDPLADKLLVSAGFIMLTGLGVIPAIITAIVVFRDFFVNALRMFGSDNSKDLAAGLSGKIKTLFQMLTITFALLSFILVKGAGMGAFIETSIDMNVIQLAVNVLMTVTALFTVGTTIWSFVDYFKRFKEDIDVVN